MPIRRYPNRLVIGRDSASGFSRVGWQSEMIEDRFEIIDLVCETLSSTPINRTSEYFAAYSEACNRVRELNKPLLEKQVADYLGKEWLPISFQLDSSGTHHLADDFGSLLGAATTLLARLSGNQREVWAVVVDHSVTAVVARFPEREMEKLEFEVWQADTLDRLARLGNSIIEGELVPLESGLWLRPRPAD